MVARVFLPHNNDAIGHVSSSTSESYATMSTPAGPKLEFVEATEVSEEVFFVLCDDFK